MMLEHPWHLPCHSCLSLAPHLWKHHAPVPTSPHCSICPPPHLPAHCSSAIGGCGKQAGFRLTLTLRPNTTYDIILSSLSTTTTQVKLSATAQTGKLVPWPAVAGSWLKPHQIPSLPFTTATFNVSSTVLELSVCMAVRVCSK